MKSIRKVTGVFLILLSFLGSQTSFAAEQKTIPASGAVMPVSQRVIRSGDTINITVWQHKDLSTTEVVDENGNIEYLFIGVIPVAGKTISELKEVLRKNIAENYIVDPKIDISVDSKSLTIFVAGEVFRPGTYEFRPGMTVLEAIAMAGNFNDYASRKVKIIRKNGTGEKEIQINTAKLLKATDKRSEAALQVDDIIVADRAWW